MASQSLGNSIKPTSESKDVDKRACGHY